MKKIVLGILITIIAWVIFVIDPSKLVDIDAANEFNAKKTRSERLRWILTHIYW